MSAAAQCFGLYDGDSIIGFCGVIHQPHAKNGKIKRCTRLVILPDYQGIGLGKKFLQTVADYYTAQGYDFSICTSARNLIYALKRDDGWLLKRWTFNRKPGNTSSIKTWQHRSKCKTASFMRRSIGRCENGQTSKAVERTRD